MVLAGPCSYRIVVASSRRRYTSAQRCLLETLDYVLLGFVVLANIGLVALYQLIEGVRKNLLPAYFGEKGKNLATQEDIAEITRLTEAVKREYAGDLDRLRADLARDTERLKAELALDTNSAVERLKGVLHVENTSQLEHLKAFLAAAVARERQDEERELGALLALLEAMQQLVIRDLLRSVAKIHAHTAVEELDAVRLRIEESFWGVMHAYLRLQLLAVRNVEAGKAADALVRHLSTSTGTIYESLSTLRTTAHRSQGDREEAAEKCSGVFSRVAGDSFPLLVEFIRTASRGRAEAMITPLKRMAAE